MITKANPKADTTEHFPSPTLDSIAEVCERASQGDLEARITRIDDSSELKRVCHAINHMLDIADAFVRESSAAMESCARGEFHRPILSRGLEGAYLLGASVINRAGVAMRESQEEISLASRMATENVAAVSAVAAACEELRAAGDEVSRQAGSAAVMTREASGLAASAVQAAGELHEVGRTIGTIIGLIRKVAGQTNLLALNATIEAARAGSHGRGFAVVAAEVKELSRSTATASDEISRELERLVRTVTHVAETIDSVQQTIARTTSSAEAIEASTREQVEATSEISQRIAEISRNTALVSERIESRGAAPVTSEP